MKGWIALDIDGTITQEKYSVPEPVISYLRKCAHEGWSIALATGRSYKYGGMALSKFNFPFYFLPQNGSVILEMPRGTLVEKNYIALSDLARIEEAFQGVESDFLVYTGYENGDSCFYRPEKFDRADMDYIEAIQQREQEIWKKVQAFTEPTPLVKCFGPISRVTLLEQRLKEYFQVARIQDPHIPGTELLLVTAKNVSKGFSLERLLKIKGRGERVIVAGDDRNDLSLFEVADIRIAMPHAPEILRINADFIAPPVSDCGIISALDFYLGDDRAHH